MPEVARLWATITLQDNLTPRLQQAENNLTVFGQRIDRNFGRNLTQLGTNLTMMTAPLVAFGVQGIRTAADFESAMAEISARTGIVGDDLTRVRDLALQMGDDTVFSAQDAANAFLELLASGQSVEEAIATLPDVLTAAAAGGEDLGRSADAVTDIMAAFGLEATDAGRIVDALSRAAGASSADMGDLYESFSNVGGVAAQFGISIEDTAAILAIFAENGVKGSEAGTQLRSMLNSMSRDTESASEGWAAFNTRMFDSAGNVRPLQDIFTDVSAAMATMTDEERVQAIQAVAGTYGQLGFTALASSMTIDQMSTRMDEQADAATVAAARMDTFSGRVEGLSGSIDRLHIEVMTPFMDNTLGPLITQVDEAVSGFAEWAKQNPETASSVIELVSGVALLGGGMVLAGGAIQLVGGAMTAFIGLALSPLGAAIIAAGAVVLAYQNNFLGLRDFIDDELRPALHRLAIEFNLMEDPFDNPQARDLPINRQRPERPYEIAGEKGGYTIEQIRTIQRSGLMPAGSVVSYTGSDNSFLPYGGARARGGSVARGMAYLVGEEGPELFTPGAGGHITPNSGMGGVNIDTINIMMPSEALRDEATARRRGGEFGDALMERVRARGYAG